MKFIDDYSVDYDHVKFYSSVEVCSCGRKRKLIGKKMYSVDWGCEHPVKGYYVYNSPSLVRPVVGHRHYFIGGGGKKV